MNFTWDLEKWQFKTNLRQGTLLFLSFWGWNFQLTMGKVWWSWPPETPVYKPRVIMLKYSSVQGQKHVALVKFHTMTLIFLFSMQQLTLTVTVSSFIYFYLFIFHPSRQAQYFSLIFFYLPCSPPFSLTLQDNSTV